MNHADRRFFWGFLFGTEACFLVTGVNPHVYAKFTINCLEMDAFIGNWYGYHVHTITILVPKTSTLKMLVSVRWFPIIIWKKQSISIYLNRVPFSWIVPHHYFNKWLLKHVFQHHFQSIKQMLFRWTGWSRNSFMLKENNEVVVSFMIWFEAARLSRLGKTCTRLPSGAVVSNVVSSRFLEWVGRNMPSPEGFHFLEAKISQLCLENNLKIGSKWSQKESLVFQPPFLRGFFLAVIF